MKLSLLPLGTRFKYHSTDNGQYVLLDKTGRGLICPWVGICGNQFDSVYSATDTEEQFGSIEVVEVH